jgi:hypothetical protein
MLARSGQMTPDLLFYPVSDEGETDTRVPDGKVLHPTPQDRIDPSDHLTDWLRLGVPENASEFVEQGRPFLALGQ